MPNKDVLVLDNEKRFLEYIHPAAARKLLKDGVAFICIKDPFTVQIKQQYINSYKGTTGDHMKPVNNYTDFFKEERDIYVQNVSNCQVSVTFTVAPGQSESFLFTNTKDPVNLTRYIPFSAIKQSMDFRKMLNRTPQALRLLEEDDFSNYYARSAELHGLESPEDAMVVAEERRRDIQTHSPTLDAPKPMKVTEDHDGDNLQKVDVAEEVSPRILNLCLQVHPQIPDQQKPTAAVLLSELDSINGLTMLDWEYVQSHGFYKSVKNLAKKKLAELVSEADEDAVPVKKTKKSSKRVGAENG